MTNAGVSRTSLITLSLIVIWLALAFHGRAEENAAREPASKPKPFYDQNPHHLWNWLHAALFIRTAQDGTEYGFDSLDPLLWSDTQHLLTGESHKQAIRVLDEFIDKHGEKLIADPLKHAVLQRDLWTVFDWTATRNRYKQVPVHEIEAQALAVRLAKIIRRLALTEEQIRSLPDNYADAITTKVFPAEYSLEQPDASFLPPDLFQKDGPWVCIGTPRGLAAPVHTREFGGRSVFSVFVSVPKGHAETLAYLGKLNAFPEPWIYDHERMKKIDSLKMRVAMPHSFDQKRPPWVNPDMPQFPVGTKFALVRQALLIDNEGKLVPTHLTESVQIRVYRGINYKRIDGGEQSVLEFKLQRANLFAGKAGGLRAVEKDEKDFSVFLTHGIDAFEFRPTNQSAPSDPRGLALNCMGCHAGAGIHSVLSHSQLFSPQTLRPPEFRDSGLEWVRQVAVSWKQDQFTWGLLKGLWQKKN